ncbi:MAG TPA: UbiA family prenyltransferase [Sphingobacteriaceae bacterium]
MRKYVRQTLDLLLFSNIFIALCAVAQGLVTYHLLNARPDEHVLGILFSATLALYNFSIFLSRPKHPERSPFARVRWIFSHQRLMITLTIIAVLSLIPLFLFLSATSKILLLFLALVSVTYNLPLFSFHNKSFSLRNIPGIKLFIIAMVWAFSAVLLPILELESDIVTVTSRDAILLTAKRFLLVAVLIVPFDIRDLYQDKHYDLKTIPVMFGEKRAYLFCQFLLMAYVAMLFLFTNQLNNDFAALTLTAILTGWLIFRSDLKKNEYYYFFLIDGVMILQYILLVLFSLRF